jgi:hypothetical protein
MAQNTRKIGLEGGRKAAHPQMSAAGRLRMHLQLQMQGMVVQGTHHKTWTTGQGKDTCQNTRLTAVIPTTLGEDANLTNLITTIIFEGGANLTIPAGGITMMIVVGIIMTHVVGGTTTVIGNRECSGFRLQASGMGFFYLLVGEQFVYLLQGVSWTPQQCGKLLVLWGRDVRWIPLWFRFQAFHQFCFVLEVAVLKVHTEAAQRMHRIYPAVDVWRSSQGTYMAVEKKLKEHTHEWDRLN